MNDSATTQSAAPSLDALCERLETLRGVRLFDIPLATPSGRKVGNNGDELIRLGAERLFKRFGLDFVADPQQADVLIMGGNGGMLERFKYLPALFREYWTRFPDKPFLLLPSTFYFPNRPLTADLPPRTAEVLLYCRERVSYDHLLNSPLAECCQVFLSHDTAFALADSDLIQRYQRTPGRHILIVERDDVEHPDRFTDRNAQRRRLRQFVPAFLKKPLYPFRAYLFSRRVTGFRRQCEEIIEREHADMAKLPRLVRDISRREFCSFDAFCQAVGDAALVFTSRLHVGILGAMLGKPTYIFPGPYHKIRAIYEHSMTSYPNAHLVSDTTDRSTSQPS